MPNPRNCNAHQSTAENFRHVDPHGDRRPVTRVQTAAPLRQRYPTSSKIGVVQALGETQDLYAMSNLSPKSTGLPFVVWISTQTEGPDDVRVWVSRGPRPDNSGLVSIAIQPTVRVVTGTMSEHDLTLLRKWIELNRDVIIQHWDGDIDSWDAIAAIKPLA